MTPFVCNHFTLHKMLPPESPHLTLSNNLRQTGEIQPSAKNLLINNSTLARQKGLSTAVILQAVNLSSRSEHFKRHLSSLSGDKERRQGRLPEKGHEHHVSEPSPGTSPPKLPSLKVPIPPSAPCRASEELSYAFQCHHPSPLWWTNTMADHPRPPPPDVNTHPV